jgi:predicted  nucleic acid-binding Zn-ribbon protein
MPGIQPQDAGGYSRPRHAGGGIPEEILTLYTRAAKRHHGIALAQAVNEQCRGCGMRLLPHLYQQVHQPQDHDMHTCENCGRILYATESAPVAIRNPKRSFSLVMRLSQ